MTREEARKLISQISNKSEDILEGALDRAGTSGRRHRATGAVAGSLSGALAGALYGKSTKGKIIGGLIGALLGGGAGFGAGSLIGANNRKLVYDDIKKERDRRIGNVLSQLDEESSYELQRELANSGAGIQSNGTDYGIFAGGKGEYSSEDRMNLKRDSSGRPMLSLLFAGINSSVEKGGPAAAHSPLAARFYNKNRGKFSDVQANSIFDDPIVSDAYIDKIVSKVAANRKRTGKYPRIRLVGYSAGGRGVVNFLKKMRERDPQFRADEIIGIDPYQFPWESIPKNLRDPTNPVADKIVYSRLTDNYTGSSSSGLTRLGDMISNTFVSLAGKKLRGLAGNAVVENHMKDISHTDADKMYESALGIMDDLNRRRKAQLA